MNYSEVYSFEYEVFDCEHRNFFSLLVDLLFKFRFQALRIFLCSFDELMHENMLIDMFLRT